MTDEKKMRCAAYCRLSKDDGTDTESASIASQKEIITGYIRDKGWLLAEIYVDAADIIGLNQKPEANGRRFSPFSLVSAHFKTNGGCNCLI